jgi:hypothetical protein
MSDALTTYLNDHLAGSVAAIELLDGLIEHASLAEVRDVLVGLRTEIQADQETLRGILEGVGGQVSAIRRAGAWLGEKAGRLKLLADDPSTGTLARLESFEMLALGILGKASLWRALAAVQPNRPDLSAFDFGALELRARDQHAIAERLRLDSARRVLSPRQG